jgi:hypothetical protein
LEFPWLDGVGEEFFDRNLSKVSPEGRHIVRDNIETGLYSIIDALGDLYCEVFSFLPSYDMLGCLFRFNTIEQVPSSSQSDFIDLALSRHGISRVTAL